MKAIKLAGVWQCLLDRLAHRWAGMMETWFCRLNAKPKC